MPKYLILKLSLFYACWVFICLLFLGPVSHNFLALLKQIDVPFPSLIVVEHSSHFPIATPLKKNSPGFQL